MTCSSYGVFFGLASACFSCVSASSYFCAFSASCAAFRNFADSLLTLFSSFLSLSAATAGFDAGTRLATPATATPSTSDANRLARELEWVCMALYRIVDRSVLELGSVDEAD